MMYDCIVIGGGVVGSSAAYHLAKKGKETLLLEQFSLPHTRGSSHGATRMLRCSYEDPLYSKMTIEALQLWKRLEKETNEKIFQETGLMLVADPPHEKFERRFTSVQTTGGNCQELCAEDMQKRCPGLFRFSPSERMYIEYNAGTLRADKALGCLRAQIRQFGGQIHDEEKVTNIVPGRVVTVKTNKRTYQTKHLVITPGAWISQLLEPLGLNIPYHVRRVSVFYWKERVQGSSKNMTAFLDITNETYAFPSSEYSGLMKIGTENGVKTSPDFRDDNIDNTDLEFMCNYVKQRFPGVYCKPSIVESCMYTLTPDENFVLDCIPGHPNIVFGIGFSGHGFKMAPVVGRILGEMVLGEKLSYDVSSMSVKRFPGAVLSSKL